MAIRLSCCCTIEARRWFDHLNFVAFVWLLASSVIRIVSNDLDPEIHLFLLENRPARHYRPKILAHHPARLDLEKKEALYHFLGRQDEDLLDIVAGGHSCWFHLRPGLVNPNVNASHHGLPRQPYTNAVARKRLIAKCQ